MPSKANRATWAGDAAAGTDRSGRLINRDNTPARPETQEPRLAAYRLDAALVVIEVAYA